MSAERVDITADVTFRQWVRALFDRVEHASSCLDGCRLNDEACNAGIAIAQAEQCTRRVWRVTARTEAAS